MGLTIHYNLTHLTADATEAERLVNALHTHAQTLGFEKVTQVFHATEDDEEDPTNTVYPGRRYLEVGEGTEKSQVETPEFSAAIIDISDGGLLDLDPREAWFFWATNEGAEPMLVGLARYPATIEHTVNGEADTLETGLGVGWHWQGFCKTQYAGLPDAGGAEHFIQSHLAVVALLDHAKTLGIAAEVHDDSKYWDHRDAARLLADLHKWNAMTAHIAGRLKDAGNDVQAPILGHPAFEHLEADGEKAFEDWRKAHGRDEANGQDAGE